MPESIDFKQSLAKIEEIKANRIHPNGAEKVLYKNEHTIKGEQAEKSVFDGLSQRFSAWTSNLNEDVLGKLQLHYKV